MPSLYTALSTGLEANNAAIYGSSTNSFVLRKNQVVEIILNNNDPGKHPFHLHGHNFQVLARSEKGGGEYVGNETFPSIPMRRDTVMVRRKGNVVLRFRADNPDMSPLSSSQACSQTDTVSVRVWLFHCHIEWHVASGLIATMIESPTDLQSSLTIPADHLQACKSQNVPTVGNAAGNTKNLLDLKGENLPPRELPNGFTPKGIIALVFSIMSAFLGVAVISWLVFCCLPLHILTLINPGTVSARLENLNQKERQSKT